MRQIVHRYGWVAIVFVLSFGLVRWAGQRGPSGQFVFADGDIGTFMPWDQIERPVVLKNGGKQTVTIMHVQTCCGVSVPYPYQKVIPPGSTVAVMLRIRTDDGPLEKEITFETDHPTFPLVVCELTGRPDPSVPSANRGGLWRVTEPVAPGQVLPAAYKILKGEGADLACTAVTSSPYVAATAPTTDEKGDVSFGLRISPDAPRGELTAFLFVTTGRRERLTLTVQLVTEVERGVRVSPQEAFFDVVRDNGPLTRTIEVEVVEPAWSKVLVETPEESCLDAKVRMTDEGKYELEVTLSGAEMPDVLNGVIVIHDGQGDRLEIPVLAMKKMTLDAKKQVASIMRP